MTVLFWMLLGDFCIQLMEQFPQTMVPLQLRWSGASDTLIGFLSASLPAVLGVFLNPFIGVQSDRHRGPMGRRRPFLLWSTPVVMLSLLGLGYAVPIAAFLTKLLSLASADAVRIGWIGGMMVVFIIANTYCLQVYQFLFVDVVPREVMGRFIGCYRAVGALGMFSYHHYFYGHAETHTALIYTVSAVIYGGSFFLMVWKVREGEYPEPPPSEHGGWSHAATYFRECFTNTFYLKTYSLAFFFWSAQVPLWTFLAFFATKPGDAVSGYAPTLGLSLAQFGDIRGWCHLVQIPFYFLVGPIVDRFHPLRVAIVGFSLCVASFLGSFLFAHDSGSLQLWLILNFIAQAVYMGAYLTILPRLLPREKYGQFFTANQIFGFIGVSIAPVLCGWLIGSLRDYRFIFVWCTACSVLGLLMCILLYRHWKRLGGDTSYHPPGFPHDASVVGEKAAT